MTNMRWVENKQSQISLQFRKTFTINMLKNVEKLAYNKGAEKFYNTKFIGYIHP